MNSPFEVQPNINPYRADCPKCGSRETYDKVTSYSLFWLTTLYKPYLILISVMIFVQVGLTLFFILLLSFWWILIVTLPLTFILVIWAFDLSKDGYDVYCKRCHTQVRRDLRK